MAAPPEDPKSPPRPPRPGPGDRKRAFATALARAELGRHYWSQRNERELREALKKKPKPQK